MDIYCCCCTDLLKSFSDLSSIYTYIYTHGNNDTFDMINEAKNMNNMSAKLKHKRACKPLYIYDGYIKTKSNINH